MTSILPEQRVLIFSISGRLCAVRIEFVREIVPMAQLACPPGMPGILHGLLNLAGIAIPVLRLDRLFGLPEQRFDLYTPLVVLQFQRTPFAFVAERAASVSVLAAAQAVPVEPQHSFNGCVEAAALSGGHTLHLISVEKILLQQEHQRLADFQAREQERLMRIGEAAL